MDINEPFHIFKTYLKKHCPPLRIKKESPEMVEFTGTKAAMQGKQKVDGYYFASVVQKPKDVRFYFFPIYTHPDQFELSPALDVMLKGKSCFHIKHPNEQIYEEVEGMIKRGIELYTAEGLI